MKHQKLIQLAIIFLTIYDLNNIVEFHIQSEATTHNSDDIVGEADETVN